MRLKKKKKTMGYLTICIFQNSFSILISLLYSNSPTHPPHFIFISSHYYSPFVMLYITSFTQFPSTSSQSHPLSSSRLQLISSSSFSSFLNLTIPSVLLIFFASFSDLLHHFLFLLFFFLTLDLCQNFKSESKFLQKYS